MHPDYEHLFGGPTNKRRSKEHHNGKYMKENIKNDYISYRQGLMLSIRSEDRLSKSNPLEQRVDRATETNTMPVKCKRTNNRYRGH